MVIALYHDRFLSRCYILDTGNNLIEIKKKGPQDTFQKNIRIILNKISDYFLRNFSEIFSEKFFIII